jgi:cytochrome c oxidase subunit 3
MTLSRKNFQGHPFHLVDLSPWPLLQVISLLILTGSAVSYFQGVTNSLTSLNLGFITLISVMFLWFRDVSSEGTFMGNHTSKVQASLTLGFTLFVVSEIFFFVSIFWAFFHSALAPTVELGCSWPPLGIASIDPFAIPILNTILLLSSGAFITYAHHGIVYSNRNKFILGTVITLILAFAFTALQGVEYVEVPYTINDSVFGSVFFFGTGFHGIHVLVGSLFILASLARIIFYHSTTSHMVGLDSAILYWHFVDVVWLVLYVFFYWWSYSA